MRVYPKGCRFYRCTNGSWGELIVTTRNRVTIDGIAPISGTWALVQPRGKLKWWLFHRKQFESVRFIAAGLDPDVLMARAILLGEPK
jgi:hypothetical protein